MNKRYERERFDIVFGPYDSFINFNILDEIKSIIADKDFLEMIQNENYLTDNQNCILSLADTIKDKTKFRNIVINQLDNISFESANRIFNLSLIEGKDNYKYNMVLKYESKLPNKYEDLQNQCITLNYYDLMKWFKKRNYLKK